MNVTRREHPHPLHWRITVDRDGVLIERGRWVGMVLLALALVMLSGCGTLYGGVTAVEIDGYLCGSPIKIKVRDGKERAVFSANCATGSGGSAQITSTDSRAFEGQAGANAVLDRALGLVERLLPPAKLVAPGVVP